jgi:hypothetical protein
MLSMQIRTDDDTLCLALGQLRLSPPSKSAAPVLHPPQIIFMPAYGAVFCQQLRSGHHNVCRPAAAALLLVRKLQSARLSGTLRPHPAAASSQKCLQTS